MHWQKRDKGTCEGKHAMESWGEEVRQRTPLAPEGAAGPLEFPQDSISLGTIWFEDELPVLLRGGREGGSAYVWRE